ncbi:MAG: carbon storage regulator CsrA [Nitrospirae bacterium]|nr:carbon storage regulator CsrA [Nitrospirota bacterium]MBF0541184.1 carbon storage regulator CsrA [Nitrospirota bacterium]
MLVLTRKINESIKLGDDITITVVEVKGSHVRLGIEAPSGVKIYRKELYDKIKAENILSSALTINEFDKIKDVLGDKK